MIEPPKWSDAELERDIALARAIFRKERLDEPTEAYVKEFERYERSVASLLNATDDLAGLSKIISTAFSHSEQNEAFRYLTGPPVSKDDLSILADSKLSASELTRQPETANRVLDIVRAALDQKRFPWVALKRRPTAEERSAAILASAALLAASRVSTSRRNQGKERQEKSVQDALIQLQWKNVPTRNVSTFNQAPAPGEFCRESLLGTTRADFVLGLWDQRIMAIECKVSNSSINSVKRLYHEAAGKAEKWIGDFGARNVVAVGLLSGVYKMHNVRNAQNRGLDVFWAHDLPAFMRWIDSTKSDGPARR